MIYLVTALSSNYNLIITGFSDIEKAKAFLLKDYSSVLTAVSISHNARKTGRKVISCYCNEITAGITCKTGFIDYFSKKSFWRWTIEKLVVDVQK